MLKHCPPSIAQDSMLAMSQAMPRTNGRNERTDADGFSPTSDTPSYVTRTRTYGFFDV